MYFDQNIYPTRESMNYFPNYPRSILYPRFTNQIRKSNIINLSKILETTQKGINTINQIVPIYKQVTPIVKQFGNFTKSISSFINNGFRNSSSNSSLKENNINPTTLNQSNDDYRNNSNPGTPYFKK